MHSDNTHICTHIQIDRTSRMICQEIYFRYKIYYTLFLICSLVLILKITSIISLTLPIFVLVEYIKNS